MINVLKLSDSTTARVLHVAVETDKSMIARKKSPRARITTMRTYKWSTLSLFSGPILGRL